MSPSPINTEKRNELEELLAALPESVVVKTNATLESAATLETPAPESVASPPQHTEVVEQKNEASNTPPTADAIPNIVISGYELEYKLGAGGYGEVWKAKGPGGLPKAVKILYGQQDGSHAEAELKSLERMRELRHPFLLGIERIEVVSDRLIVVTELADGNLTDRFKEHREKGRPGIPRDELLAYLRDAADALDFMSDAHGLQHLDIKPDNILVIGNHAKIGDFGLAKDLNVTNVSMVNGFTPLYAGPELFEGNPGRSTDQYSLAIVYQVMLTGKPPFSGRNAAQLTAQHLRSQPDLTNLQPIDRPVIARALSKTPHSRYTNCREFVDELSRRKVSRSAVILNGDLPVVDSVETALLKTDGNGGQNARPSTPSVPVETTAVDATRKKLRPSVVISTGSFSGEILKQFGEQVQAGVPILHIDTNRESIAALRSQDGEGGLDLDQAIAIPLRSSKDYRAASQLDLSWLSRRWLFNIPRSNQVEGIRPLGRLALYDHKEAVAARIRSLVEQAFTEESRQQLQQQSQCEVDRESIDIHVVGTTFGGTSSGTFADLGLMIRGIAQKAGWKNLTINGLLVHTTGATRNVADVHEANAVCLLKELKHLATPGLGTPRGFVDNRATREYQAFDYLSVFELPPGGTSSADEIKRVVTYLRSVTSTPAQFDLNAWKAATDTDTQACDPIRLIGAGEQDVESLDAATDQAHHLATDIVQHWCDRMVDRPATSESQAAPPAHLSDCMTLMEQLALTEKSLTEKIHQLLKGDIGRNLDGLAQQYFDDINREHDLTTMTRRSVLQYLGNRITVVDSKATALSPQKIIGGLQQGLSAVSKNCEQQLRKQIFSLLDSPGRFNAAWHGSQLMLGVLEDTEKCCQRLLTEIESAFHELANSGNPDAPIHQDSGDPTGNKVQLFAQQYCLLFGYQSVYQSFYRHVHSSVQFAKALGQRLKDSRVQMRSLIVSGSQGSTAEKLAEFDQCVRVQQPKLLQKYLEGTIDLSQLKDSLLRQATLYLVTGASPAEDADSVSRMFPADVWPESEGLGGQRRVTALVPQSSSEESWRKKLHQEFGRCVAIRQTESGAATAICEIAGVTIDTLCSRLTSANPHVADLSSRVHVRNDVDW